MMRWYDWAVIFLMADMASAVIVAIMMGAIQLVFMFPLLVIAWLSYEDFRVRLENDKESE
jgi:hypothetical protein